MENKSAAPEQMRIVIRKDGPIAVYGSIPLVRKIQVVSEAGEPLTWKKEGEFEAKPLYFLCRCGRTKTKPFCDKTHLETGFDGTETADTRSTCERRELFPGGTHIAVWHDDYLCSESGFCGTRSTTIQQIVPKTEDINVRTQVISMVEHCPSSSLTFAMSADEPNIEPDYPRQIAVTTDITSDGPVEGAFWVTGNIPIERADGKPFETLNRVTLCSCGCSRKKPFCDGIHRRKETEAREPSGPPWSAPYP